MEKDETYHFVETTQAYVYIMRDYTHKRSKIGFSVSPKSRMSEIQMNCIEDLKLVYTSPKLMKFRLVERVTHKLLSHRKVKNEWFKVENDEAIAAIEKAILIVEQGKEEEYIKPKNYNYTRLNTTIGREDTILFKQVRDIYEKRFHTRLSTSVFMRALLYHVAKNEKILTKKEFESRIKILPTTII